MAKRRSVATLAIHPRRVRPPGPVVTPIVMSSTFRLRDARQGGEFTRAIAPKEYYTRWGNPTIADLEESVATLEGGAQGLATGVDVVLHSATKYLGGHTDVVAGVAVARTRPLFEKIWYTYKLLGPTIGPFEAFLVRRGIKTLPLRVQRQNRSAGALAEHLDGHPAVSKVHYPGLRSFDQHRLARRQMEGFGGMLSIELKGGD